MVDVPKQVDYWRRSSDEDFAAAQSLLEQEQLLREFGVYQLEGRSPDSEQVPLDSDLARAEISKAKEMLEWLKKQL